MARLPKVALPISSTGEPGGERRPGRRRRLLIAVAVAAGLAFAFSVSTSALTKTTGGEIAVIRNGGRSINTSLAADLDKTLGGPFITGVRFNLAKITLPDQVQEAINKAQAAFAAVTEAQAKEQQAKAEAAANAQRQLGYQNCPACAQIDTLKAIPPNVTTFAPGAGFAITSPAKQ